MARGSGKVAITFDAGLSFDPNQITEDLSKATKAIKQAPVDISTPVKMQDVSKAAGGTAPRSFEQLTSQLESAQKNINKIVATEEVWVNKQGQQIKLITKGYIEVEDAQKGIIKQNLQFTKDIEAGYKKAGTQTYIRDYKAQAQELRAELTKNSKEFDAMISRANNYSIQSKNWTTEQRVEMQKLNDSLSSQVKEYRSLVATGDMPGAKAMKDNIEATNKSITDLKQSTIVGAGVMRSWGLQIKNAIQQTISYTFSLGALRAAQQLLNSAVSYTIELNKEMINIQLLQAEGAKTDEDIASLAQSYNSLARELGATTVEVARGSVEWLRQGKTIEETTELLRASTMLSKLGAIDSAQATEYLTATLNSYNLGTQDAVKIVDKLIAVDNAAATSTKELASALKYSAAIGAETGVTFEQLVSYIGVVSSTTRQNAESIGQAFKTMLARMQDIRNNKLDEDGMGINNVERALNLVDIKLRDSQGNFRDFGIVLEELAKKWDTIGEKEGAYIAKSIAGVRQINMFTVLMQNMDTALELQEKQFDSAGLTADRYRIYMEGVEAAQNELKAATEAFYMQSLESGLIVSLLKATTAIVDFTRQTLDLKSVIVLATGAMVLFNATSISSTISALTSSLATGATAWTAFTTAIWGATAATTAFNIASGVGIAIIAVGAAIAAFNWFSKEGERAKKSFDEATESFRNLSEEINRTKSHIQDGKELVQRYEELKKQVNLTAEETKELADIQNKLKDIFPALEGSYDSELNFKISSKNLTEEILELEKQKLAILKEQSRVQLEESAISAAELVSSKKEQIEEDKKELERITSRYISWITTASAQAGGEENLTQMQLDAQSKALSEIFELERKIASEEIDLASTEKILESFYKSLNDYEKSEFRLKVDPSGTNKELQDYFDSIDLGIISDFYDDVKRDFLQSLSDGTKESIEATNEDIVSLAEKNASDLRKIYESSQKFASGEATQTDIDYLTDMGVQLDIINGKYQVNQRSISEVTESLYSASEAAKVMGYSMTAEQEALYNSYVGTLENANIAGIQWSSQMVQAIQGDLATMIWSSGITLTDVNGNIMGSEAMVAQALASNAQNAINWLVQMQKAGILTLDIAKSLGMATQAYTYGITPYKPTLPSFGGGGGGGGKSKEQERIEKETKRIEQKKNALKDLLDEYKDYIKTQKEILKNQKEEAEFTEELMKKNQSLAKLKSEIAILALDDSEEARAKRLKLEEEAAQLEEEITKSNEDRKYELQIKALEDAEKAYEDKINAQIDKLDEQIDKLNETKEAISGAGGVGGAVNALGSSFQSVFNTQILPMLNGFGKLTDEQKLKVMSLGEQLYAQGLRAEELFYKIQQAVNLYNNSFGAPGRGVITPGTGRDRATPYHTGGFVGANSNEEFAKLLKGEYVATEGQMGNFMKNILPKIAGYPSVKNISSGGNISLSMPINVAGSLDEKVIPSIEKIAERVVRQINDSMKSRGYIRSTNTTSI